MDEDVEIDEARRREILAMESRLATANHFEVLGVAVGASPEAITGAFREASKRFHPDRYFGKRLGSFKGRLERIFKRLVEAHTVLTDPARLRAWLDTQPHLRAQAQRSSLSGLFDDVLPPQKSADEERRDAERRTRLGRHPYLAKVTRVHELLGRAKEAMARAEYSHAYTWLNQAQQAAPNNAEVKALLIEVRRKSDEIRAETNFKAGLEALGRDDERAALAAFRTAVSASASHHEAAWQAAQLLEKLKADPRDVIAMAQKAVDAAPDNAKYRVLLGRHMEVAGMKVLARKHLEEAARLAPDDPEVKKHVKKRWSF